MKQSFKSFVIKEPCLDMNWLFSVIFILSKYACKDLYSKLRHASRSYECNLRNEYHEIHCSINEIYNVKKKLEKKVNNFISTEIEWLPLNSVEISKEKQEGLMNFFEILEDDEDVQNFFSNAKFVN